MYLDIYICQPMISLEFVLQENKTLNDLQKTMKSLTKKKTVDGEEKEELLDEVY